LLSGGCESLDQRDSERAGGVRLEVIDAGAQVDIFFGDVDFFVDLQANLLYVLVELGVKVDVAFSDYEVQRFALAIVG